MDGLVRGDAELLLGVDVRSCAVRDRERDHAVDTPEALLMSPVPDELDCVLAEGKVAEVPGEATMVAIVGKVLDVSREGFVVLEDVELVVLEGDDSAPVDLDLEFGILAAILLDIHPNVPIGAIPDQLRLPKADLLLRFLYDSSDLRLSAPGQFMLILIVV